MNNVTYRFRPSAVEFAVDKATRVCRQVSPPRPFSNTYSSPTIPTVQASRNARKIYQLVEYNLSCGAAKLSECLGY